MADAFKKAKPGDKLRMPAAAYNAFIDAARDLQNRQRSSEASSEPSSRSSGIITVKNGSGADQSRYAVLGISAPIFTPADNLDSFKNKVALVGVVPAAATHAGRFVILLEPLKAGAIGQGYAAGVSPVKLYIPGGLQDAKFADVMDADTSRLQSASQGAAFILWKSGASGTVWAIVRIGVPPPNAFWVRISGSIAITGRPGRFLYTGVPQIPYTSGDWQDKPGSSTIAPIYNTVETYNSASGIQSNSADLSKYPTGTLVKPIQGNPILWCRQEWDCYGNIVYFVSYENAMPEACS